MLKFCERKGNESLVKTLATRCVGRYLHACISICIYTSLVCMHAAYDFYLCIKYFIHMTIFIFYACLDRLCLKFKWTSAFANKDQKKGPSGGMKLFGSERFTRNPVNFKVSLTQEGQVQLRHQQVPCRDRRGG